jgi:hypothetical protein
MPGQSPVSGSHGTIVDSGAAVVDVATGVTVAEAGAAGRVPEEEPPPIISSPPTTAASATAAAPAPAATSGPRRRRTAGGTGAAGVGSGPVRAPGHGLAVPYAAPNSIG